MFPQTLARCAFLSAVVWLAVVEVSVAGAQDDETNRLSTAALRARIAAADALLARHDWRGALTAYEALASRLYGSDQSAAAHVFACRTGVARLGALPVGPETARVDREIGTGFVSQTTDAGRVACASAAGLALADAAARAARAAPAGASSDDARGLARVIDDTRFRAAVWLRRARALRDTAPLRAAFEGLDPSTRAELVRLSAGPPADAVDSGALARDLARSRYLADPASVTECSVGSDGVTDRAGLIDCYSTPLPEADGMGGEYPHTLEYFIEGPSGVRYAGGATHMPGYDCETSLVRDSRSWTLLTATRDRLDGVVHIYREGSDAEDYVDLTTTADVCDAAQRKCVTFQIGRRTCEFDLDARRVICAQRWEAAARVRRGVLTFRRLRGELPPANTSSILSNPFVLADLFATSSSAPTASAPAAPAAPAVDARVATQRPSTGDCHAEVADPRPPLNVRTDAEATSAVVGTLPNGTRVTPRGRRHGFTRVEAPIAGWIWARNLQRVCGP